MTTACAVLFFLLPAMAAAQTPPGDQIEKALLAEDWPTVGELLKAVTHDPQASPDPVLRWIRGHERLWSNRNNESVSLFLSVADAEDRKKCRDWADAFAARHPTAPIAAYLRADALARVDKFGEAIREYSRVIPSPDDSENYPLFATEKNAANPLIYNARGVAFALDGQLAKARLDFQVASETPMATGETGGEARYLADAFANIGALMIQQKDGAEGAKRALDRALEISPQFAFALYARGCIALVSVDDVSRSTEQRMSEAEDFFRRALEQAGCARGLLVDTHATFLAESLGLPNEELAKMLANQDVAASLFGDIRSLVNEHNATGRLNTNMFNRVVEMHSLANPGDRLRARQMMDELRVHHPEFNEVITAHGQWRENFNNSVSRLTRPFNSANVGVSAVVEVGVDLDIRSIHENSTRNRDSIRELLGGVNQNRLIRPVDGVLADLSAALWDSGEWPFGAMYGLCYQYTSE